MAKQTDPVKRRVAVKIIKPGLDFGSVLARFKVERQALAMMNHPNIARIYDGGTTEDGRPFFSMELVNGIPITEYCDQAKRTNVERLRLFTDVCRAVQHAHQKGIIHRELDFPKNSGRSNKSVRSLKEQPMTKRKPKPKTKTKRRTYSDEFKREAVNLVVVEGLTVTAAARDLGINPTVLRNWKLQYDAEHETSALTDDERLEMARLQAESCCQHQV